MAYTSSDATWPANSLSLPEHSERAETRPCSCPSLASSGSASSWWVNANADQQSSSTAAAPPGHRHATRYRPAPKASHWSRATCFCCKKGWAKNCRKMRRLSHSTHVATHMLCNHTHTLNLSRQPLVLFTHAHNMALTSGQWHAVALRPRPSQAWGQVPPRSLLIWGQGPPGPWLIWGQGPLGPW